MSELEYPSCCQTDSKVLQDLKQTLDLKHCTIRSRERCVLLVAIQSTFSVGTPIKNIFVKDANKNNIQDPMSDGWISKKSREVTKGVQSRSRSKPHVWSQIQNLHLRITKVAHTFGVGCRRFASGNTDYWRSPKNHSWLVR